MRKQHYHLERLANDAKSEGRLLSSTTSRLYTELLNDLESSLHRIGEQSDSFIISNINAVRLKNTDYYSLNFKNNRLHYHRVRPEKVDRYELNFDAAELKFNEVPQGSEFLLTFLDQVDDIIKDLEESRAVFYIKKEVQHG